MGGTSGPSGSKPAEQSNVFIKLWKKSGLEFEMIMLSLKGALPSTIALAAYQAPAYANVYTTLGYFVAVIAMLSMAMQPRAKFIQTITTTALFLCFAAAINILVIFCAVKARDPIHNTDLKNGSSGSIEATPYDASANTVAATWLFFNVFFANYLKSKRPQLAVPATQFNFYGIITAIYAPSFPDMPAGLSFARRLLITFLTAYGFATGVHIFIWPTTSRHEVKKQSAGLISALKECLESYKVYTDSFGQGTEKREDLEAQDELFKTLKEQSSKASGFFAEIKLHLDYARKEIAIGKLNPDQLHDLYVGMREVLQPIMGLTTFLQIIVDSHMDDTEFVPKGSDRILEAIRGLKADDWGTIVTMFRDSHAELQEAMCQGLDHIVIQLELVSRRKTKHVDIEHSTSPQPGQPGFAQHLEQELREYQTRHDRLVQEWLDQGLANEESRHDRLYLMQYLDFLWYNAAEAILRQVYFADGLCSDGTMKRRRFIFPGFRATGDLMMGSMMDRDQDEAMGMSPNGGSNIWVGDLSNHKKNPEHLPPANAYERITDYLRLVPEALSSSHANFGFRSAVATLSIALPGFLAQSRAFFLEQRWIWAASTTAIAFVSRFGPSIPAFCMRIVGTVVAAGISIAISYIADHNPAGIIVLFYFQAFLWLLFEARFPSFELATIVGSVAVIIIVGNELQVDALGLARATSNGDVYYPIYFLALYRLAAISAGIAVATIWSIFPYPVTSHGSLRQDTANTLYILANYHSCVHATLELYPQFGSEIAKLPSDHPVRRLEEARQEVFGKSILMLGQLRGHLTASRYEPRIGGKFPHDQYEQLINTFDHVFTYLTLMTYSSKAFIRGSDAVGTRAESMGEQDIEDERTPLKRDDEDEQAPLRMFRESIAGSRATSHKLTSALLLLASSIHSGQPLPPYLSLSHHHDSSDTSNKILDTMDASHFMHPYYAAFIVNKITGSLVNAEVTKLIKLMKDLVGEIDFSFHIMSTSDDSSSTLVNTYSYSTDGSNGNLLKKRRGS